MDFSDGLVSVIDQMRFDNESNDANFLAELVKYRSDLDCCFGAIVVAQELADLEWLFDESDCQELIDYLANCKHQAQNLKLKDLLSEEFEREGIVIRQYGERFLMIHPNNREASRLKYPIQMSEWIVDDGVIADRFFENLDSALAERDILASSEVEKEKITSLEQNFIESEARFRSKIEDYRTLEY